MAQMKYFFAKNREASRLRRRKHTLVRRFGLSENALGGHLAMTYRRCGKPTCPVDALRSRSDAGASAGANGQGHPRWTLSYSFEGEKRVEVLPETLASELAPLVEQGREFREAIMEVLAINLQLLRLWRAEQHGRPPARQRRRAGAGRSKHKPSR